MWRQLLCKGHELAIYIEIHVDNFILYFSLFQEFNSAIVMYTYCAHISMWVSWLSSVDDVSYCIVNGIFNANFWYPSAYLMLKFDE